MSAPELLATRRAVVNALAMDRDPYALGLPRRVVAWHLLWIEHSGFRPRSRKPGGRERFSVDLETLQPKVRVGRRYG